MSIFNLICIRLAAEKLSFVFEGSAVGAFGFGGVGFVGADLDMIEAAAVAVSAVIGAVVDAAADVSVSFHNKKPPSRFAIIFNEKGGNIQEKCSILFFLFIKIL